MGKARKKRKQDEQQKQSKIRGNQRKRCTVQYIASSSSRHNLEALNPGNTTTCATNSPSQHLLTGSPSLLHHLMSPHFRKLCHALSPTFQAFQTFLSHLQPYARPITRMRNEHHLISSPCLLHCLSSLHETLMHLLTNLPKPIRSPLAVIMPDLFHIQNLPRTLRLFKNPSTFIPHLEPSHQSSKLSLPLKKKKLLQPSSIFWPIQNLTHRLLRDQESLCRNRLQ